LCPITNNDNAKTWIHIKISKNKIQATDVECLVRRCRDRIRHEKKMEFKCFNRARIKIVTMIWPCKETDYHKNGQKWVIVGGGGRIKWLWR
jgi:hypothetical protein